MARVLFALDLGGGYGHLRRCLPMADAIAARGHEVAFALRGSSYADEVLGGRRYRLLAAPVNTAPPDERLPAENWADVLLRTGHDTPDALANLLRAWLALYEREQPALVICDFAPAALMAARVAGLRTIDTGSGYSPPPRLVPMPPTRFWLQVPAERLAESEARALGVVNAALGALGVAPLAALADTLAASRVVLNCFPEFDHYGVRPDGDYFGNDFALDAGIEPTWPAMAGPRVFTYLRAGSQAMGPALAALRQLGVAAVVHARDLRPQDEAPLSSPTVRVTARPVRMGLVQRDAAVVVCHSPATAAAALLAGRAVVLLPEHVEQMMAAWRLAGQGLALVPAAEAGAIAGAIRQALDAPGPAVAAFADRYHGYDPAEAMMGIADLCDELLKP